MTISRLNGLENRVMNAVHIACAVLVPLLWGAQYTVIKVGLAVFPPLFFAGLRFDFEKPSPRKVP